MQGYFYDAHTDKKQNSFLILTNIFFNIFLKKLAPYDVYYNTVIMV